MTSSQLTSRILSRDPDGVRKPQPPQTQPGTSDATTSGQYLAAASARDTTGVAAQLTQHLDFCPTGVASYDVASAEAECRHEHNYAGGDDPGQEGRREG